ncbi:hypothetical protein PNEG_03116 [Pneumocystis murina B123]|uniref:Pescadillo homolog n=1 Tax=Pneumocystis murina (strain B123) TaxID=1069680 RepID=M7P449_PNEMU|nr:hypothetical protein PNEG_03116 [Pneumocystis murina B123]EMR08640.1 hypothetical protein PNEG_03116 [Pneumocystis murina B123]
MTKIKSKGKSGAAKNFITRNQALKKLQVTLADFRRLCIFKGIYPREPRNKKKANKGSTAPVTFYYSKDIQYLLHEPIIDKIRQYKIYIKKFNRALTHKEYEIVRSLEENKPFYTLDHIIKERYPTFLDAIRDLDDALSMLSLFSSVQVTEKIDSTIISNCERLCLEFQNYVIVSKALRKTFLSIKGIYYQVEIKGQEVTWLVPYKFSQRIPVDIDLRIMLTFLEFYQTFVGFINYKLYTDSGLTYPPPVNVSLFEEAGDISAYNLEKLTTIQTENQLEGNKRPKDIKKQISTLDKKLDKISEETNFLINDDLKISENIADEAVLDNFSLHNNSDDSNKLIQPVTASSTEVNIFEKFIFYLSREVPRYSLEFVIKSFGGKVGWDPVLGSGSLFKEDDMTITHQVYDRPTLHKKILNRIYIQPQWVYDCINKKKILSTNEYAPGSLLPPHLSPFVKIEDEGYNPEAEEDYDVKEQDESNNIDMNDYEKKDIQDSSLPFSYYIKKTKKSNETKETESEEIKDLSKVMLTNKQRKLYKKMIHSNLKKKEEIDRLKKRRKELIQKNKKNMLKS